MSKIVIVLNRVCPFAERALIALEQKGIPYEIKEVSLTDKQPFFTSTYKKAIGNDPTSDGKVPILIDGDYILTQSDLIVEYLDEKYKDCGSKLIPMDPQMRINVRLFNQSVGKIVSDFYGFMSWKTKPEEERLNILLKVDKDLTDFDNSLMLPFALGEQFTMSDLMIFPWFLRSVAHKKFFGFEFDSPKFIKINEWLKNVKERASIKKITFPSQFYIDGYASYFSK